MPTDRARTRRKASPDDRTPVPSVRPDEIEAVVGVQIILTRDRVWATGNLSTSEGLRPRTPELLAITQRAVRSAMTEIARVFGVSVAESVPAETVSAARGGRA